MVQQSLWDHLGVPLPDLTYEHGDLQEQGKGSTTWAAHSHTPVTVSLWTNFDAEIAAAAEQGTNRRTMDANVQERINVTLGVLDAIIEEEDVTTNTHLLLKNVFTELSAEISILKTQKKTTANPDLIACKRIQTGPRGDAGIYQSPPNRTQAKRSNQANCLLLFPFETKPFWKFRFLGKQLNGRFGDCDEGSAQKIVRLWEVPPEDMLQQRELPEGWTAEKKKIFHLIRQVYGQMVSDNLKYGVIHIYELWWFCCRDAHGDFKISKAFDRQDTTPSVLQAIKTLDGFEDKFLEEIGLHPASATKTEDSKPSAGRSSQSNESSQIQSPNAFVSGQTGGHSGGSAPAKNRSTTAFSSQCDDGVNPDESASNVFMWDCKVIGGSENIKILSSRKDPSLMIKMQKDPTRKHVAEEMENEATVYKRLSRNKDVRAAIPSFHGFSNHLGVALLCTKREGPDFEHIGVENLGQELKLSAVESLQLLSQAGVVHHDLELRNIVQSAENPEKAKIIDFGRAEFSEDRRRLQEQVEALKSMLGIASGDN